MWSISSHIDATTWNVHSPAIIVDDGRKITGEVKRLDNHWEITTTDPGYTYDSVTSLNSVTDYNTRKIQNPPGTNPTVVFTLEKFRGAQYPGTQGWKLKHWPDNIIFSTIIIEPKGSIDEGNILGNILWKKPSDHTNYNGLQITSNGYLPYQLASISDGVVIKFNKDKTDKTEI